MIVLGIHNLLPNFKIWKVSKENKSLVNTDSLFLQSLRQFISMFAVKLRSCMATTSGEGRYLVLGEEILRRILKKRLYYKPENALEEFNSHL